MLVTARRFVGDGGGGRRRARADEPVTRRDRHPSAPGPRTGGERRRATGDPATAPADGVALSAAADRTRSAPGPGPGAALSSSGCRERAADVVAHARRGLGQSVLVAIAATVTVVLVGGSLMAIHTQSQGYRNRHDGRLRGARRPPRAGLGPDRRPAGDADGRGGRPCPTPPSRPRHAASCSRASTPPCGRPADQATRPRNLASPPPEDDLGATVTQVMGLRATATTALRSTVDRLLGMQPLPIAGAPSTTAPAVPTTQISADPGGRPSWRPRGAPSSRRTTCSGSVRAVGRRPRTRPTGCGPSVWVPAPDGHRPARQHARSARPPAPSASSPALVAVPPPGPDGRRDHAAGRAHRRRRDRCRPRAPPRRRPCPAATPAVVPPTDLGDLGHGHQLRERARARRDACR